MRIHIIHKIHSDSWGGGNQFLAALRTFFETQGLSEPEMEKADILLFDSYQNIATLLALKKKFPHKKIFYRLGPVFFYHRGKKWKLMDILVTKIATYFVDGVIFQSNWSEQEFQKLGFRSTPYTIIHNAPGKAFLPSGKKSQVHKPVRLICVSWSKNKNKGFDFFQSLEKEIQAGEYSMHFIGNTPIDLHYVKNLGVLEKEKIIEQLQQSDIFIAPFAYEACSNAIVEALATALPVIALNSGGNKELIGGGGEVFETSDDMKYALEKVIQNYDKYRSYITFDTIDQIGKLYQDFFEKIIHEPTRSVSRFRLYGFEFISKIVRLFGNL